MKSRAWRWCFRREIFWGRDCAVCSGARAEGRERAGVGMEDWDGMEVGEVGKGEEEGEGEAKREAKAVV